jgi:hypothetical protein
MSEEGLHAIYWEASPHLTSKQLRKFLIDKGRKPPELSHLVQVLFLHIIPANLVYGAGSKITDIDQASALASHTNLLRKSLGY